MIKNTSKFIFQNLPRLKKGGSMNSNAERHKNNQNEQNNQPPSRPPKTDEELKVHASKTKIRIDKIMNTQDETEKAKKISRLDTILKNLKFTADELSTFIIFIAKSVSAENAEKTNEILLDAISSAYPDFSDEILATITTATSLEAEKSVALEDAIMDMNEKQNFLIFKKNIEALIDDPRNKCVAYFLQNGVPIKDANDYKEKIPGGENISTAEIKVAYNELFDLFKTNVKISKEYLMRNYAKLDIEKSVSLLEESDKKEKIKNVDKPYFMFKNSNGIVLLARNVRETMGAGGGKFRLHMTALLN